MFLVHVACFVYRYREITESALRRVVFMDLPAPVTSNFWIKRDRSFFVRFVVYEAGKVKGEFETR